MQFNQITYFLRTCDTLNFTRAAELCNVSQPSLSAAILKLEEELGGELFERSGRNISLTALGNSMRTHLLHIEQARDAASQAAFNIVQAEKSVINVGLMCTLSPGWLLSAIASFGQTNPDVELLIHDIWATKAQELLLSGALDCVIMAHTIDLPNRLADHRLMEEPMLLAMHSGHPLAKQNDLEFSQLQDQPYVDRLKCEFREVFFRELGERKLAVRTVLRSEREDLVRESIAEGIGVSIVPRSAAANSKLVTRAIRDMNIKRKISIVTVKDRPVNAAVTQLISLIKNAYKKAGDPAG